MTLADLLIPLIGLCYLAGIGTALYALMHMRSAEGCTAWVVGVLLCPFLAVPLYWIFEPDKFRGYVTARRTGSQTFRELMNRQSLSYVSEHRLQQVEKQHPALGAMEAIARQPLTGDNHLDLLIDGKASVNAMFAAMDEAQDYLLVQFYIVAEDQVGAELRERMIARARAGIRVYFIYDQVGSSIAAGSIEALQSAGVQVSPFKVVSQGRLHVNFRNHRKILVVDGHTAFLGGVNVSDPHLGRDPTLCPWRDTHLALRGPAAQAAQMVFLEDWYWGTEEIPELNWQCPPGEGHSPVLVLPSGPSDDLETCGLFFHHLINSAQRRVWITSPYFVPDQAVMRALQLAALRGVDVRILIPRVNDSRTVALAMYTYLPELLPVGVKMYQYRKGFVHQKVMLVDDDLATVGTANLDNRSLRLNFEVVALVAGEDFARQVHAMLTRDFAAADPVQLEDYTTRPLGFRLLTRAARLMAPIL